MIKKLIATFVFIYITLSFMCIAYAWEQPAHININFEAIKNFQKIYGEDDKYIDAPIVYENQYEGLRTTSASLLDKNYKDEVSYNTIAGWVTHGGYSADEPNLYESVRHFYDPLKLSGSYYLTDQIVAHGTYNLISNGYSSPMIDAKVWGISYDENPFSFDKGLEYYYEAMTVAEKDEPKGFLGLGLFRSRDIEAKDSEKERELYLSAAFRAVGETMHLMGDMTQPAHVRNDAHPIVEPVEQGVEAWMVLDIAKKYGPDPEIAKEYYSEGASTRQSLSDLFKKTATYTNSRFYSADTISDKESGINPENGEEAYASPQFKDLVTESSFFGNTLYATYNGITIPMATNKLDGNYIILPSFAKEQAKVLIPVAISACTEILDRFFPTMELLIEKGSNVGIKSKNDHDIYQIPIYGELKHYIKQDIEWERLGLEIRYSGPGIVVLERENEKPLEIKVNFLNGKISEFEYKRKMQQGNLNLYQKSAEKAKLTSEQSYFEVENGDVAYIVIEAGGRKFTSEKVIISAGEFEIDINTNEPKCNEDIEFSIKADNKYFYSWDLKEGDTQEGLGLTSVTHSYIESKEYLVKVNIYKDEKKEEFIGTAYKSIHPDDSLAIEINPSNNLEAKVNDKVEINVSLLDNKKDFGNSRIIWEANEAEIEDYGETLFLLYKEVGTYSINVKITDLQGKILGKASATISILDKVDGLTMSLDNESVIAGTENAFKIYQNGKEIAQSEVSMYINEGYANGGHIGDSIFYAPNDEGVYHIDIYSSADSSITGKATINVIKDYGVWKLKEVQVDEVKYSYENMQEGFSGMVSHSSGTYMNEDIYVDPGNYAINGDHSYEHYVDASWDVPSETLIPGDKYKMELRAKLTGGAYLKMFLYESSRVNMAGDLTLTLGDDVDVSKIIEFDIMQPKDRNNIENNEYIIKVQVFPHFNHLGTVEYIYIYEFVRE